MDKRCTPSRSKSPDFKKHKSESLLLTNHDDEQFSAHPPISSHTNPEHSDYSNSKNEIKTTSKHPSCQFKTDKKWLDCQFHDSEHQSIKKPDEIEDEMQDPPNNYDKEILDRIQGSMIGMALGDALGAHVEFRPREYLRENPVVDLQGGGTWGLDKGQFTDDTSMALCLANSLIACQGFNCYDQLVRYKWWYMNGYMSSTGKCFDIGSATSQSLGEFARRQRIFANEKSIPLEELDFLSNADLLKEFNVYCSEDGVAGNGALMRLTPVPLFFYKNPAEAVEFSGISGQITHGDTKAYDACRYYGALIVASLRGETKEQLLDKEFYLNHRYWFKEKPLHPDVLHIVQGSYQRKGGYDEGIRGKGYIVNALEAALWAFWSDENSFKKGAIAAVSLGDDTDTTAAIYGQLAGAFYGYKNLPSEWVQHVYAKKFIETLSKWIAYEGQRRQTLEIYPPLISSEVQSKNGHITTSTFLGTLNSNSPPIPSKVQLEYDYSLAPTSSRTPNFNSSPILPKVHSENDYSWGPSSSRTLNFNSPPILSKVQLDNDYSLASSSSRTSNLNSPPVLSTVQSENGHRTVPTLSQTSNFTSPTTHIYRETFKISPTNYDRTLQNESSPQFQSFKSNQIYQSSFNNKQTPLVPKIIEPTVDIRTLKIGESSTIGTHSSRELTSNWSATTNSFNLNKNFTVWSISDVCHWIQSFGENYAVYVDSLKKDHVDGFRLCRCINDEILIGYGINNEIHRQKILDSIGKLKKIHLNQH